jgi:hypothetical protein
MQILQVYLLDILTKLCPFTSFLDLWGHYKLSSTYYSFCHVCINNKTSTKCKKCNKRICIKCWIIKESHSPHKSKKEVKGHNLVKISSR